MEDKLPKAIT